MDKLTIEQIEKTINDPDSPWEGKLARQLLDTMRENARLTLLLKQRFDDGKRLGVLETEDRLNHQQHKHSETTVKPIWPGTTPYEGYPTVVPYDPTKTLFSD